MPPSERGGRKAPGGERDPRCTAEEPNGLPSRGFRFTMAAMSTDYVRENITLARALRANMTPQERHLWYDGLRHLPMRFQRQKAIGPYIADFYCHRARLVVELDGSQHYSEEARAYNERRTAFLATHRG